MSQMKTILINDTEYNLADNGKRLLAGIIDIIILMIPGTILGGMIAVLYFVYIVPTFIDDNNGELVSGHGISQTDTLFVFMFVILVMQVFAFIIGIIIFWFYHAYIAYKKQGQTYGKQIMKIRVIDQSGQPPSLKKMSIRSLAAHGLNTFTSSIHYISILINEKRLGIHDMAAKTYVVEEDLV